MNTNQAMYAAVVAQRSKLEVGGIVMPKYTMITRSEAVTAFKNRDKTRSLTKKGYWGCDGECIFEINTTRYIVKDELYRKYEF